MILVSFKKYIYIYISLPQSPWPCFVFLLRPKSSSPQRGKRFSREILLVKGVWVRNWKDKPQLKSWFQMTPLENPQWQDCMGVALNSDSLNLSKMTHLLCGHQKQVVSEVFGSNLLPPEDNFILKALEFRFYFPRWRENILLGKLPDQIFKYPLLSF